MQYFKFVTVLRLCEPGGGSTIVRISKMCVQAYYFAVNLSIAQTECTALFMVDQHLEIVLFKFITNVMFGKCS